MYTIFTFYSKAQIVQVPSLHLLNTALNNFFLQDSAMPLNGILLTMIWMIVMCE